MISSYIIDYKPVYKLLDWIIKSEIKLDYLRNNNHPYSHDYIQNLKDIDLHLYKNSLLYNAITHSTDNLGPSTDYLSLTNLIKISKVRF